MPNSANVRRTASTCWPLFTTMPANVCRRESSRTTGASLMHSGRVPATINIDGRAVRKDPRPERACPFWRSVFAECASSKMGPSAGIGCRLGRSRSERSQRRDFGARWQRAGAPTGRGAPTYAPKCNNMLQERQAFAWCGTRGSRARCACRGGWARLDSNQRPRDYESPRIWYRQVLSGLRRMFVSLWRISKNGL